MHIKNFSLHEFGNGYINDSYILRDVDYPSTSYLLQRINHGVFLNIDALSRNIWVVTNHLRAKYEAFDYPDIEKRVLRLIPAVSGEFYYQDIEDQFWRMYLFIEDTRSYERVTTNKQAYQGGKAFGQFQAMLSDLGTKLITPAVLNFLNLEKRMEDFEFAVGVDPLGRAKQVKQKIRFICNRADQLSFFQQRENIEKLPLRVIHGETKFNNILLNENDEAQCVVDLDSLMPGYVAYDYGNAIRTVINTSPEDEPDLEMIDLDISLFTSYTEGYLVETRFLLHRRKWHP